MEKSVSFLEVRSRDSRRSQDMVNKRMEWTRPAGTNF